MSIIDSNKSLLTQTTYSGYHAIQAICRFKAIKFNIAPEKYPNGERKRLPIHLLKPKIDNLFLQMDEGKIIKKAVRLLFYHQIIPSKKQQDVYTYLNNKLREGISYGEARSEAINLMSSTRPHFSDNRISSLFSQLVAIIQPQLTKHLKTHDDDLEVRALFSSMRAFEASRCIQATIDISEPETIQEATTLQTRLRQLFQEDEAKPVLLTLNASGDIENRVLFVQPSVPCLYDSQVGLVVYKTAQAMLKDIEKQLPTTEGASQKMLLRTVQALAAT